MDKSKNPELEYRTKIAELRFLTEKIFELEDRILTGQKFASRDNRRYLRELIVTTKRLNRLSLQIFNESKKKKPIKQVESRDKQVYDFVRSVVRNRANAPMGDYSSFTINFYKAIEMYQIKWEIDLTPAEIMTALDQLIKKGFISRDSKNDILFINNWI